MLVTRRLLFWVPLLVALSVGVWDTWGRPGPAETPAGENWPAFPAEARAYLDDSLRRDLRTQIPADARDYGLRHPLDEVAFGTPVPTYRLTPAFLEGDADDRQAALVETGEWVIPVRQHGRPRAVVRIGRDHDGAWGLRGLSAAARLAETLPRLRSHHLLFEDVFTDAIFVLRGSSVSELDTGGRRRVLRGPVPLSRFDERLRAAYQARSAEVFQQER